MCTNNYANKNLYHYDRHSFTHKTFSFVSRKCKICFSRNSELHTKFVLHVCYHNYLCILAAEIGLNYFIITALNAVLLICVQMIYLEFFRCFKWYVFRLAKKKSCILFTIYMKDPSAPLFACANSYAF